MCNAVGLSSKTTFVKFPKHPTKEDFDRIIKSLMNVHHCDIIKLDCSDYEKDCLSKHFFPWIQDLGFNYTYNSNTILISR